MENAHDNMSINDAIDYGTLIEKYETTKKILRMNFPSHMVLDILETIYSEEE